MQDVVIVAASRTAIGSFQGSLANVAAVDLGAAVIRRLLEQTGLEAAQVDEVILGHVLTAGAGQNTARQAAIKAGLPNAVPHDPEQGLRLRPQGPAPGRPGDSLR